MYSEALRGAEMRWLLQVLASFWRLGRSFTRCPMVSDMLASTFACDSMLWGWMGLLQGRAW